MLNSASRLSVLACILQNVRLTALVVTQVTVRSQRYCASDLVIDQAPWLPGMRITELKPSALIIWPRTCSLSRKPPP